MNIVEWFINLLIVFLKHSGYIGIFILMTLESMLLPIPSEIVLPFSGYLSYLGILNLYLSALAGALGCLAGSLIAYYIGYFGGRAFVLRYGKYVLMNEKTLISAENWFKKYGPETVFGTRLLPVFRTFISIPAGLGKMNIYKFMIYTFTGSFIWSFVLVYLGYLMGPKWTLIFEFFKQLDVVVYAVALGVFIYIIYRLYIGWKNKNKKNSREFS